PDTSVGCNQDSHCDLSSGFIDGTCERLRNVGEACDDPAGSAPVRFCVGTAACVSGGCVGEEQQQRHQSTPPILGSRCDESTPIPELQVHCRFPAACLDPDAGCQMPPVSTCP